MAIDGRLDEAAWSHAPWTELFEDIEGDGRPAPRFRTRAKMLWDDECFYIGAWLEEPHVWGTLTEHDSVIFHDNDFEVFLDPDGDNHAYGEFEMNALNTGWDLFLDKPYKDGGPARNEWEISGLRTAVHVDGTLNDPSDTDHGWSVELAFPWRGLGRLFPPADGESPDGGSRREGPRKEPRDGDQWRVNFSRVEWLHEFKEGKYQKVPNRPEDNWVWSPQWVINMHRPETWGYVQFVSGPPGSAEYRPDASGPIRHWLHRVYYAQASRKSKKEPFAADLKELGLEVAAGLPAGAAVAMVVLDESFTATVTLKADGRIDRWHIRQDSKVWHEAVRDAPGG
jgi:hypothetical protein